MALTKITGQVINDTTGLVVGVTTVGGGVSATDGFFSGIVTAVGDASFSGNVSVGGTLTYEDVTNIDAVGLVTARNGIVVGSGITLSKDGDIFATGVTTATTFSGSGASLTNLNASNLASGTVPSARLGSGTASSSTFLAGDSTFKTVTGTTINSNANNRVITGSDTANTLEGESTFTFDGTNVQVPDRINLNTNGSYIKSNQLAFAPTGTAYIDHYTTGQDINFRTSVSSSIDTTAPTIKSGGNLAFAAGKGIDFTAASGSASGSTSALLDDYEEGTYDAFVKNGMDPDISSNASAYQYKTGYYRKIGTLVEFNFFIQILNDSTYEGDGAHVKIGLPFTQDYATQKRGHGVLTYHTMNNINVGSNGIHIYIYDSKAELYSGATAVTMGNGDSQADRYIIGGGHFHST